MMQIPKSLSDVADYLSVKDTQTLKEYIDKTIGEIFIPAATIVSLIFSPVDNPI